MPEPSEPIALVAHDGVAAVASSDGSRTLSLDEVDRLNELRPRWVWWSARETASLLIEAGGFVGSCWDLGAVGALHYGLRRNDPAAVWAAAFGLPEPRPHRESLDLFDLDPDAGTEPIRGDGQLSAEWTSVGWRESPERMRRWAELALELYDAQRSAVQGLPDPRPEPRAASLPLLTAFSESAAALLAIELERCGLPLDRQAAIELLEPLIGGRDDPAFRGARMAEVLRHFPGSDDTDLRSPEQVRALLARVGLDLPDTRSWRLEPHATSSPGVAALLAWRKTDRVATTYGWRWLDSCVGADGRLRGPWGVADGGAGRMTAGAGLHNMPAELRPVVRAEAGYVFVRADLGQVEPRVLAAISRDPAFVAAARDHDLYAPVAAALGCERSIAKVAVLAAMYGQTSGTAGAALRDMERIYPTAMTYLRDAERHGREGVDLRTYGGRLLRFGSMKPAADAGEVSGRGRYARNAAVQGPAAELFKAWAATVRHAIAGLDAQIVLCLHDELLLHVRADLAEQVRRHVHESLDATVAWWAAGVPIRFVAEVTTGSSWAESHG